jgi:hypothetical protein
VNPQDPLAALNPLREPTLIGWWPMAPGWWVLLGLLVIGLAFAAFLLWRSYRRNAYRRIARRQLREIQRRFNDHGDASHCLAEVNALLKSVALVAYPHRQIASVSGEPWLAVLNADLPPEHQLNAAYLQSVYGPDEANLPVDAVLASASLWIRRHRGIVA